MQRPMLVWFDTMSQTFRHFFPGISISLIYAIAIKKIGVSNISRGLCMIRHQSGGDEKKKKTDGGSRVAVAVGGGGGGKGEKGGKGGRVPLFISHLSRRRRRTS